MKRNTPLILILLVAFSLFLASCSPAAAPEAQTVEPEPTSLPSRTSAPTEAPPAPTAAPTAVPEPIACTIAFESDRDGNPEIYRMAPDGSDLVNLSSNPGDDFEPAWSPDGKQIAFASNRDAGEEGGQSIYVMNADGSGLRQLTFNYWSNWPAWSHDGTQITYTGDDDIFIIHADGSGQPVNLTNSPERDRKSTWSPDGSKLAWLSAEQDEWNIFVMDSDGRNQQKLTHNGKVHHVQWTIDGQLFSNWEHPEGLCGKCVMNADGSDIIEAGGKGELQRFLPFWTLAGDRVECIGGENIMTPDSEIYLVGEIFPDVFFNLTNHPAEDRNPAWPANCGPVHKAVTADQEQPQDTDSIVIGYAGDEQWQVDRKNDFQKACDELGIQCIYGEIPELIALGADAIVQNSNTIAANGLFPAISEAKEKGVPVFILDAETNIDGAYSVTIDHQLWAETSLVWMFEKMGGKGQFGYFDLDPFNRYSDTINKLLKRYPGISVADKRDGKYDRSKIKPEFTNDFINVYPELKAIWTSYDQTQAIWGMEESGIPYEKWPVIVCETTLDGLLNWQRIRSAYAGFDCIALANPSGIAYDAAYAAYYLVSGARIDEAALAGPYGKSLYVDIPVVTNDNLQEWLELMKKAELYNVNQFMTSEEILAKWFVED